MAVIRPRSIIYTVVCGEHQGKRYVIVDRSRENEGLVGAILADGDDEIVVSIRTGTLIQSEIPGWPEKICGSPYGLDVYFTTGRRASTNLLRTTFASQPRVLKPRDILATRDMVTASPRRGFNGSILICVHSVGWIEVAPRFALALQGNKHYKLPIELVEGDTLLTGCQIVAAPTSKEVNWVSITLDRKNYCMEVPSCVPLALAEA